MRDLAKKYGVEIKEEAVSAEQYVQQSDRDSLYIVMNYAKDHYRDLLFQNDEGKSIGLSYFRERGFNDRTIEKFDLGYSLNEWDNFNKKALSTGYSEEMLEKAGLIQQLGSWLGLYAGSGIILVLTVVIISIFISELMSNVAQVIVFTPVVCSLADSIGMNPLLLGVPMTLAASCASMLPMGTPPNAIVFASGHIKIKDMIKAGFVLNIICIILITLFCWLLQPVIMRLM